MHPNVFSLANAVRVAYEEEPWRIKDMLDSFSEPQMKCKEWLLEHLEPRGKGVVLGGWYGMLAHHLGFKSVDIDPECVRYGKMLYPETDFCLEDAFNHFMECDYDTVICTSCEHMPQEDLDIFNYKEGLYCLQSNNWEGIGGHINCKSSLEEFVSDYSFDIHYAGGLDMGEYKRWMLIGTTSLPDDS